MKSFFTCPDQPSPSTARLRRKGTVPAAVPTLRDRQDEGQTVNPTEIGDIPVATPGGQQIPLKEFASIKVENGASFIYRENGERYTGVQFAGEALSSQQLIGYARDALRITQEHARGMADWLVLCATLEQAVRELRLQAGQVPAGGRLPWPNMGPTPPIWNISHCSVS